MAMLITLCAPYGPIRKIRGDFLPVVSGAELIFYCGFYPQSPFLQQSLYETHTQISKLSVNHYLSQCL